MVIPTVFLINGYAQSGKDSLANAIIGILGQENCVKMSFADPLKEAATEAMAKLGHPQVNFHDEEWKKKHRKVLVALAEAAREENPDTFANLLAERAGNEIYGLRRCVVVPDWRYTNELAKFANWQGCGVATIRIRREGTVAANPSEEKSVREIEEAVKYDLDLTLADGDLLGIQKFAEIVVKWHAPSVKEMSMKDERRAALDNSNKLVLTEDEIAEGWHFCTEWDGMLVHPLMEEFESCDCYSRVQYRKSPSEDDKPQCAK